MPTTFLKPRWTQWEEQCIRHAFEKKIRFKIIAAGMGRTLFAVSKKIKRLGLVQQSTQENNQARGGLPSELEKMRELLKKLAPLAFSQKGQLALRERYWVKAKPLSAKALKNGGCLHCISQDGVSFSLRLPLNYVLSEIPVIKKKREKKLTRNSFCVPLSYIEEWAASEGFHPVPKNLRRHGFSYWKEGDYFSKAQLLIYINRIRLEKQLQPLAYHEEG